MRQFVWMALFLLGLAQASFILLLRNSKLRPCSRCLPLRSSTSVQSMRVTRGLSGNQTYDLIQWGRQRVRSPVDLHWRASSPDQ